MHKSSVSCVFRDSILSHYEKEQEKELGPILRGMEQLNLVLRFPVRFQIWTDFRTPKAKKIEGSSWHLRRLDHCWREMVIENHLRKNFLHFQSYSEVCRQRPIFELGL